MSITNTQSFYAAIIGREVSVGNWLLTDSGRRLHNRSTGDYSTSWYITQHGWVGYVMSAGYVVICYICLGSFIIVPQNGIRGRIIETRSNMVEFRAAN